MPPSAAITAEIPRTTPVAPITTSRILGTVMLFTSLAALPQASPAQMQSPTIASLPPSRVIAPAPSYSFPTEKYVFSVRWQFFNAGTSTVVMQRTPAGLRVTATADSAGMADKIFRVHDVFNADVDPHTFCTLHVSKHNEEGPRRRDFEIRLDYPHSKSQLDMRDLKTSETKHTEFDIPPCVTDIVSAFFYVASLPLAPGFSHTFPVNDNGKTFDARIQVEARETVKGPAGEFQALRVRAEPLSGPMKGKVTLLVWFTDDSRHIPVQMKSKLGFASLSFQLQKSGLQPSGK
jgi:hypothetical protein